jgi:hypothetical protein
MYKRNGFVKEYSSTREIWQNIGINKIKEKIKKLLTNKIK